jgi:hypothetical protein
VGFVLGDYLPRGLAGWLAESFEGFGGITQHFRALYFLRFIFFFALCFLGLFMRGSAAFFSGH